MCCSRGYYEKMLITPTVLFRFRLAYDGYCRISHKRDSLGNILFIYIKYRQQRGTCFNSNFLNSKNFSSYSQFACLVCSSHKFNASTLRILHNLKSVQFLIFSFTFSTVFIFVQFSCIHIYVLLSCFVTLLYSVMRVFNVNPFCSVCSSVVGIIALMFSFV